MTVLTGAAAGGTLWTPDEEEVVKARWIDGESCTKISKRLRNRSRNAVIGLIHRRGWADDTRVAPTKPSKPTSHRAPRPRTAMPEPRPAPSPMRAVAIEAGDLDRYSAELVAAVTGNKGCKWPFGDPARRGFHFCGARRAATSSYCADHRLASRSGRSR